MGAEKRAAAACRDRIFKERQAAQFGQPLLFLGGLSCAETSNDVLRGLLREVRHYRRTGRMAYGESDGAASNLCEKLAIMAKPITLPDGIIAIHGRLGDRIYRSRKQPDGSYRVFVHEPSSRQHRTIIETTTRDNT